MFRSNLGSPTAHSRETPVVRTASTPKHGKSSKKHAHLSSFLTGDRKAESSDHPVWKSEEEKKGKKVFGLKRLSSYGAISGGTANGSWP